MKNVQSEPIIVLDNVSRKRRFTQNIFIFQYEVSIAHNSSTEYIVCNDLPDTKW